MINYLIFIANKHMHWRQKNKIPNSFLSSWDGNKDTEVYLKLLQMEKYGHMYTFWTSLVAQTVKNLPAVETRVWSLGQEDPLDKGMTMHSSILA